MKDEGWLIVCMQDGQCNVNQCLDVTPSYLQRRRGSKDAAGDEKSEWERRLDKPSVPLKAIGDPGPPKIVEIQEKYGAVEGMYIKIYFSINKSFDLVQKP